MKTETLLGLGFGLLFGGIGAATVVALAKKDDGPHYYIRPSEYIAGRAMCEPLGGLTGLGVVVPNAGRVRFIALCKEGRREWQK